MSPGIPSPRVEREAGLPERVQIFEVGPRDGLQAETDIVPTPVKIELCRRLYAAGASALEITSFVPATWIPQLADAEEVLGGTEIPAGARGVALVPNMRGFERAVAAGAPEISVVVSATEAFAKANLNTTREEGIARGIEVVAASRAADIPVRAYISMAFGDPWEGRVETGAVTDVASRLFAAGASTVAISDTIGVATPGHVSRVVDESIAGGVPAESIALHLHDTYGQALSNVHAALRLGVAEFDSAVGGLGRCPYAKGATGNVATEDLVWMLHGLGIDTGLDLRALAATTAWLARARGIRAPSRVAAALAAAGLDETESTEEAPSR